MNRLLRALLAMLLTLLAAPASADELRPAVIELAERDARVWLLEWKFPVSAVAPGEGATVLAQPVFPRACTPTGEPVRRATPLALLGRQDLRCTEDLAGQSFGLSELIGKGDAIARFMAQSRPLQTFHLTATAPTATIAAAPDTVQVLTDYPAIGAEHILFGWDHLLFVIALMLALLAGQNGRKPL